ncbi:uncharacterized protein [Miscanthus floridulus]|uniref:uncharacterized protein n=1 Tax=Miscanthus floridulus TaxID=154761 RepID=UPI00345A68FB
MTRHYTKQKEVGKEWLGHTCPKIRKKLNKNTEWASTCYAMPSGEGIFQVQDRDYQFIVDIKEKKCECRRWDLTGIPCAHAISCLRHERVAPESVLPECYSTTSYLLAYGQHIRPCRDKSTWDKVAATEILPPIYDKKVGRPPKSRKKQPHEFQGPQGPRLSKHGVTMHCRYCGDAGHNKKGCTLRKAGVLPPRQTSNAQPEEQAHPGGRQPEQMDDDGPIQSQVY